MKTKWLWIISGIIAFMFLVLLISLAATDNIGILPAIMFCIIIVLIIAAVDFLFWFLGKRSSSEVHPNRTTKKITKDEANDIADSMMLDIYAEYEEERPYEDIWAAGSTNTPVFVRLSRGEFSGDMFGIVINMEDPDRTGIKVYKIMEDDRKSIDYDLKNRANLVAVSPNLTIPERTVEEYDPLSGRSVKTRTPINIGEDVLKKEELE